MLRKKVQVLQILWNQVYPCSDAEERRCQRLRFLAQRAGRLVDSANELSDDELEQAIQILHRVRISRGIHRDARRSGERRGRVKPFPNRGQVASKEMIWKIRQLEQCLRWAEVPERLSGFLEQFYKVRRPEDLTHRKAWQCIESLFAIAARARIKREKGSSYKVGKAELAAAVVTIKAELASFTPNSQAVNDARVEIIFREG